MISRLRFQIRGNLKYDLIKTVFEAASATSVAILIWLSLRPRLLPPVESGTLLGIWLFSTLTIALVRVLNCRLMILAPRLEYVSERPDAAGYKRRGADVAICLPIRNRPRWWHSGLAESQLLTAHLDFFSEDGRQVEADCSGMWLDERKRQISMRYGETKELIVAVLKADRNVGLFVPQAADSTIADDRADAHSSGAELSLRKLEDHPTLLVEIRLMAPGYRSRLKYRLFADKHASGMEALR
jgi:hypothetical protein